MDITFYRCSIDLAAVMNRGFLLVANSAAVMNTGLFFCASLAAGINRGFLLVRHHLPVELCARERPGAFFIARIYYPLVMQVDAFLSSDIHAREALWRPLRRFSLVPLSLSACAALRSFLALLVIAQTKGYANPYRSDMAFREAPRK